MHKLTKQDLTNLSENLKHQPDAGLVSRAIQTNGINNVARDPRARQRTHRVFSIDLKTKTITDQKRAGFCWLFAALNVLRHYFAKKYHFKDFKLSSNYLLFWDKLERANVFFDHMIKTADKPTDDRGVTCYLEAPDDDGGEWDMAVALIDKYGLMPDSAFPRTKVTNSTIEFDMALGLKMRRDGMLLRRLVKQSAGAAKLARAKQKMMDEVYRMTAESFGVPPKQFDFEYRDDKKRKGKHDPNANYHLVTGLTPKQFYTKYFSGFHLDDYVSITNYPDKKIGQLYQQKCGDNVEGGRHIHFLNLPMDVLKRIAIAQMKDGTPVWFGNDVEQQESQNDGFLDGRLYHRAQLFDVDLHMTKKQRFQYDEATPSHAMTFTGVDLVHGKPTKWRVENSWGPKVGKDGYFVMTDDWMNNYVYEVIVNKKYLTADQRKMLHMKPIELKPWE